MAKTIVPPNLQTGKRSALSFCPHCRKSLIILPGGSSSPGPGGWRQMAQLQSVAGDGAPSVGDWQKITPIGRLVPTDVTTSLYDAVVSFCLVSVGGVGICFYAGWPWPWALIAGYGWSMWRYFGGVHLAKNLLEIVESLSAPQSEPEPSKLSESVNLEVVRRNEAGVFQKMFRASLPGNISEGQFAEWCKRVLMRPDLTQARWVDSGEFARNDYTDLLVLLGEGEIVRRKSKAKNAPWVLTDEGRKTLNYYIRLTHSHSLTRHGGQNE